MTIFVVTLIAFLVAFFALSVGMIFGNVRIKGHCGNPSLDGGCCDSEPQLLDLTRPVESRERCIVDAMGNKIQPCDTCSCDK